MAGSGLVSLIPASISNSGGTATVNNVGQVVATGVSNVSLNGVFSATYRHYHVIAHVINGSAATARTLFLRLRNGGTDDSSSTYDSQILQFDNASQSAARYLDQSAHFPSVYGGNTDNLTAVELMILRPFLADQTLFISAAQFGQNTVRLDSYGGRHKVTSSFDGFTLLPSADTLDVTVSVYGYEA